MIEALKIQFVQLFFYENAKIEAEFSAILEEIIACVEHEGPSFIYRALSPSEASEARMTLDL